MLINGIDVFFEPDEERCYNAVRMPRQDEKQLEKIDRGLLQAIQENKLFLSNNAGA